VAQVHAEIQAEIQRRAMIEVDEYVKGTEHKKMAEDLKRKERAQMLAQVEEERQRLAARVGGINLASFGGGPSVDVDKIPCSTKLSGRGVDVEWLRAWTDKNNLWALSTEEVVNFVIKPLTRHLGCRFVELGSQVGTGGGGGGGAAGEFTSLGQPVVGPADCFVSHCWSCPWGDVVAAVSETSRPGRRVWLDVMAVNQHFVDTMIADLTELTGVIASVPEGLLLVADSQAALENMRFNPLKRIWCVYEVVHALAESKPIVLKLGKHASSEDGGGMVWRREWERSNVAAMVDDVDVLAAGYSKREDYDRIVDALRLAKDGTADRIKAELQTCVWTSFCTRGQSAFHYAVMGPRWLGWSIDQGVDLEARNPEGWTALHSACNAELPQVVKALLRPLRGDGSGGGEEDVALPGADVNAVNHQRRTPLFTAAWNGSAACVEMLLAAGADPLIADDYGMRPLDRAEACLKRCRRGLKTDHDSRYNSGRTEYYAEVVRQLQVAMNRGSGGREWAAFEKRNDGPLGCAGRAARLELR